MYKYIIKIKITGRKLYKRILKRYTQITVIDNPLKLKFWKKIHLHFISNLYAVFVSGTIDRCVITKFPRNHILNKKQLYSR